MHRTVLFIATIAILLTLPAIPGIAGVPVEKVETSIAEGNLAYARGQFDKATASFESALADDPDNLEARYYLGLIAYRTERYEKAIEHLTVFVAADANNAVARLHLGLAHYRRGNLAEALDQFKAADRVAPSAQAKFYTGLVLLKKGDSTGAAAQIDAAVALEPALKGSGEYMKAVTLINGGKTEEATVILKRLAESEKNTALGSAASELLKGSRSAARDKRLAAGVSLGFMYDSNVILQSESGDIPLPAGITNESDERTWLTGFVSYRVLSAAKGGMDLSYRLYEGINMSLSDYNFHQHELGVAGDYTWGIYTLHAPYAFAYTFVASDFMGYSFAHLFTPSLTIKQGSVAAFKLGYDARFETFLEKPAMPWWDRTGTDHKVSLTEFWRPHKRLSLGFGYAWEFNDAKGRAWRYQGHHGVAAAAATLWKGIRLDLAGTYIHRSFDNSYSDPRSAVPVPPADLDARRDNAIAFSGTVTVPAYFEWLEVGVSYGMHINRSNAWSSMYDWNRHLVGTVVTASY